MNRVLSAALVVLGAGLAAVAQTHSDATRVQRTIEDQLYFVPAPAGVRMVASGFEEVVADLFWVRAVFMFGDRYDTDESVLWHDWLRQVLGVVTELDPEWRTPYQYGGGMLRVTGQIDEADALYEACTERLPDVPWCPFARGMNDLLEREDPIGAAAWLKIAASRPGAPSWYGAAAAAILSKQGERRAGLAYIDEQLQITTDEAVRARLLEQRGKLLHTELVSRWEEACRRYRAEQGHPLSNPAELASLGIALPENPRGDAWIVGRDGVVRSEGAEAERVKRARRAEWKLVHR